LTAVLSDDIVNVREG